MNMYYCNIMFLNVFNECIYVILYLMACRILIIKDHRPDEILVIQLLKVRGQRCLTLPPECRITWLWRRVCLTPGKAGLSATGDILAICLNLERESDWRYCVSLSVMQSSQRPLRSINQFKLYVWTAIEPVSTRVWLHVWTAIEPVSTPCLIHAGVLLRNTILKVGWHCYRIWLVMGYSLFWPRCIDIVVNWCIRIISNLTWENVNMWDIGLRYTELAELMMLCHTLQVWWHSEGSIHPHTCTIGGHFMVRVDHVWISGLNIL